jgi:uncharacterized protein (TIGR00369 family)
MSDTTTTAGADPATATGFGALLGFRTVEAGADRVVLRWAVENALLQGYGIVNGGAHCAAVEQAARTGACAGLPAGGEVTTVSVSVEFLQAVRRGELTATAAVVSRGDGRELWYVEVCDDAGRRVAVASVRLATRPS